MAWFGRRAKSPGAGSRGASSLHGEPAWWHVMEFEAGPPGRLTDVEQRFRRLAARAHPDRGGSVEGMQRLIRARAQARRQLAALR